MRFKRIKEEILSQPMRLCTERAYLITEYFKKYDDRAEPVVVRRAKASRHLMKNKSAIIFPDELIVGNMSGHRKAAIIQPELAGVFLSQDLLWIDKRKTTPFVISWRERLNLLFRVMPFWLFRNMIVKAFFNSDPSEDTAQKGDMTSGNGKNSSPGPIRNLVRYAIEQLNATYYLINIAAGIGHFLPNYEKIIGLGIKGYLESIEDRESDFHDAVRVVCEGVVDYSHRMADEANRLASKEGDETRKAELIEIARICKKVPFEPASTFQEAIQSLWFSHMAICLEGINSAVSFGRMDQYLYPYYRRDIDEGRLTPERAKDILLSFSAKSTEHVFHISGAASKNHGGYLIVQAAIVGGMDKEGKDAVNELTYVFLDVMEESGLRDPNYQVRVHQGSPDTYLRRAVDVARQGNGVPAFFSDEAAIASLVRHGYPILDARDYAVVGCVELAIPGKSFLSTDAAIFNLPICLEFALNRGKKLSGGKRVGAFTPDPRTFTSIDDVIDAFRVQVQYMVKRMTKDLDLMDRGNRDFHPTPFSSMLVDGCLESGMDVSNGGAIYNGSGIQGVGVADTADSLAALDDLVFGRRKYSLKEVIKAMGKNFAGAPELNAELINAPKFGNDLKLPDSYANMVVQIFHGELLKYKNIRGGPVVPGFYSSTCHVSFGEKTGALPSGRRAKEPFAASLGAVNGMDRNGPTALLNSVARVDSALSPNGYATNLRFDHQTLAGDGAVNILTALTRGFFDSGGMEMQLNVLDPGVLEDARSNPGKYPGLVVRVAGYCAYFDDLPDQVKGEIIGRTRLEFV